MSIVKSTIDICPNVFVYGTLKNGHGNNVLLRTSEFVKETRTKNSYLLVRGQIGVPFVFPKSGIEEDLYKYLHPVQGHLFKVDSMETFKRLDRLEGHPSHYTRVLTELEDGEAAWMYTIVNDTLDDYLEFTSLRLCHLNKNGSYEF